jgi:hypothetical protein
MKDDFIVLYNSESWMNKNDKKSLSVELLEASIQFFIIFTPIFVMLSTGEGTGVFIRGMLLLPVNLFIAFLKCRIKNGKRFLLYNIAIILLLYLFYPSFLEKLVYSIVQFLILVLYLIKLNSQKIKFWTFGFFIFNGVFFTLVFLLVSKLKLEGGVTLVTLAAIHNIISLLIYFHIVGRDSVLAWEKQHSSRLMDGMKKTSSYVIVIIAITLVILNVLLWQLGIFRAADAIKFSLNFNKELGNAEKNIPKEMESAFTPSPENFPTIDGEPSPLLSLVATIIEIIFAVAAAVFIMYLIFTMIIRVRNFLLRVMGYKHNDEKRESIFEESDLGIKLSKRLVDIKSAVKEITDFSNDKKIRNLYRKLVRKYKLKGVVPEKHSTAGDISFKIENVSSKDYSELTELYRKARYSKELCSQEDLEAAKKYL